MVLEEQTLHYFLKAFSLLFIILLYFFYFLFFREITLKNEVFNITKNQNYLNVVDDNINDNFVNIIIYKSFLNLFKSKLHYGKFKLSENRNFKSLIETITKPSNVLEKIIIIEGSSIISLNLKLKKMFDKYQTLEYNQLIADTYYFNNGLSFQKFKEQLHIHKKKIEKKYNKSPLSKKFTFDEILVIGSLLEKEGLDYNDKKNIYSVIVNRLKKNMKLQIDATVIYALTEGNYNLNRKLTYNDLKIKHNFNTYFIYGLPPMPISYVGSKTIELILENYKTNYLFYFFNTLKGKHIYSTNYINHLKKLNEYRSKK